ncbi:MAG: glycosyltransferase family 39 protein [Pseudomonadota bacterium]
MNGTSTALRTGAGRRTLVWILVSALLLRAAVALGAYWIAGGTEVFHNPDTAEYVLPAKSLLSDGSYSSGGVPEIVRTPGYSLLLIPGILLGNLELVTIVFQVLLSVFTVFLVYRIGLVMWDNSAVALTAAALYAVEPLSVTYASFLFTEAFFTALLTAALLFLVKNLTSGSRSDAAVCGALFAASAYVRPISMFLPFAIAGGLILLAAVKGQLSRRSVIHAATVLAVFVILVVPWQIRNRVQTGYSGFSAISDHNLHFSVQAAIMARETGVPFLDYQYGMGFTDPDIYFGLHPGQRCRTQAQIAQWRRWEGLKTILDHPRTYGLLALHAAYWAIRDTAATGYLTLFNIRSTSKQGWWASVVLKGLCAVLLLGYYFFAGLAVVHRGLFKDPRIACLVGVCAYFIPAAAATCIGFARFRLPVMPILCVFAAYGVLVFWERTRIGLPESPLPSRSRRGRPPCLPGRPSRVLRGTPTAWECLASGLCPVLGPNVRSGTDFRGLL